ncbi:MAG: hypothetical protein JO362_14195, partial [Streptomycetaceae bacterium]|nr:hypothetical protein [Streptomycetaceae bacterium]
MNTDREPGKLPSRADPAPQAAHFIRSNVSWSDEEDEEGVRTMSVSHADWTWVERRGEFGFCLFFAKGVSEEDMLAAYGCYPDTVRVLSWEDEDFVDLISDHYGDPVVRVGRIGEWVFGFEEISLEGSRDEVLRAFPAGTETISLFNTVKAFGWFRHAVDGVTVAAFELLVPSCREGSDPDRHRELMRQVGMGPDEDPDLDQFDPIAATLDMITAGWGVYVSEEMISGPLRTARIHP